MTDQTLDLTNAEPATGVTQDELGSYLDTQRFARAGQVNIGLDGDPDTAAHSVRLEAQTGVPAAMINSNYEDFTSGQKKLAAQNIVSANPDLEAYVMSHPLATTISADDWANLDKFTRESAGGAFQKFREMVHGPLAVFDPIGEKMAEGLVGGLTQDPIPLSDTDREWLNPRANPLGALGAALGTLAYGAGEVGGRAFNSMGGLFMGALTGAGAAAGLSELEQQGLAMHVMATSGGGEHPTEAATKPGEVGGIEKHDLHMMGQQISAMDFARPWLEAGREPPTGLHPEVDAFKTQINAAWLDKLEADLKNISGTETRDRSGEMATWLAERKWGDTTIGLHADAALQLYPEGKVPEVEDGVLGWVPGIADQLEAARETGSDVEIPVADYLSKIDPALAKTLHDDIRMYPGGVTAREATALPTEAKGVVQDPVALTRAAGGLEPKFSVGDRKLSLNLVDKYEGQFPGSEEHDYAIHDEHGVEVGSLRLTPNPETKQLYVNWIGGKAGLWANSFGPKLVRDIKAQIKALYPDYEGISGFRISGARAGKAMDPAMREVPEVASPDFVDKLRGKVDPGTLEQMRGFKDEYDRHLAMTQAPDPGQPGALEFDPVRAAEAKEIAAAIRQHTRDVLGEMLDPGRIDVPTVKLDVDDLSSESHQRMLDIFQSGWENFNERVDVNRQGLGFYTPDQLKIGQMAYEEATRLTGGYASVEGVAGIQNNRGQTVRGLFGQYYESRPTILFDLLGPDAVGVVRHEAIHLLRGYNFFRPGEWETLAKAAEDEGWLDRFKIRDKLDADGNVVEKGRYSHLDHEAQIEEAVAEGFREWAAQAPEVRPKTGIGAVFQKIWDLFDRLRERLGLGPEATFEDVFNRVHSGEVVRRGPGEPREAGAFDLRSNIKMSVDEDRKLKFVPVDGGMGGDLFEIHNSKGEIVADGAIQARDDGSLYVENLWEAEYGGVNKQGTAAMRDLLRQIAEHYPNQDRITGFRETGARHGSAVTNPERVNYEAKVGLPKFSIEDQRKAVIEGIDNLQASSIGMDKVRFQRIKDAIRARAEDDLAKARAVAEKEQAKRQTKEWKADRAEMAGEVAKEIRQRPDVAADLFIGSGELYGRKIQQRFTLAEGKLTDEQKAALPDHYVSKSGLDPDQVAGLFGYSSGDEMISRLGMVEAAKNVDGKRARTEDYIRKLIQTETDRRMEQRYGNLGANILDAAEDQALSKASINVQYEEYRAVAEAQGVTVFDKSVANQAAKNLLSKMPIGKVSSFRIMQDMGRDARNAEKAIADGKWGEAVVHMQRQTMNMIMAKEAKAVEKAKAEFDKTAKRWAKREQPSVSGEFANWIQDTLARVGKRVRLDPADLARQIQGESGTSHDLAAFVREQNAMGGGLDVWEGLLDPAWRKAYKDLTVEEFQGVKDSVDTLIATGRRDRKIVAQGEEYDRAQVIDELAEALKHFPKMSIPEQDKRTTAGRLPRSYLARAMQIETVLNRWDRFNPFGAWTQKVFRDLKDGDNQADAWRKEYSRRLGELDDGTDLSKAIDNKLFKAPDIYGGDFLPMNRGSLRAVMLNLGTESNVKKLTKGWRVSPEAVRAFVDAHAKPEDWKFVQGVWDIFGELKDKSDTMYRSLGRRAPKTHEAVEWQSALGPQKGGYYPIQFHRDYAKIPKLESAEGLLDPSYESLTPPAGYTIARQNFYRPLAMDIQGLAARLNQVIHDTAMRPAVENFGKVIFDPKIKAAITQHAGRETYENMVDYIKGVANKANTGVQLWRDGATVSEFMRQNIMTGLVGFNPGTVLKHGFTAAGLSIKEVGPVNFAKAVRGLFTTDPATGLSNYQFAMQSSLELQRRDRNYAETLHGSVDQLSPVRDVRVLGKNAGPIIGKALDFRQRLIELSSKPLAFSDKLSSVPTWLAEYDRLTSEGYNHGDAIFGADRAVRRAHGSTSITSRPTLMNTMNPWLTTFYNFFNDIFNRQVETLWRAGEARGLAKSGQYGAAMKMAGTAAAGVFAYSIWPAIVEEWVAPQPSQPDDSEFKKMAKALAYTEGATMPVVRDLVNGMIHGKNPDVGLWSTLYSHSTNAFRDLTKNDPFSDAHAQKLIRDSGQLGAVLMGVPEQFGRLAAAGYGLRVGSERPEGPWAWLALGRYGTTKGHSRTFDEYMHGEYDRRR